MLDPLSACMLGSPLTAQLSADILASMFGPQEVCELGHLLQSCLLTFLLPCLAPREYVNWTIYCKVVC
jgi:hypothetical protein